MRGLSLRRFALPTFLATLALVAVPSATGDHNGVDASRDPAQPNGDNGWYTVPVAFTFSGPAGYECTPAQTTYGDGPEEGDGEHATVSTTCTDPLGIGPELNHSFELKYDETPPDVSVEPGRPPDQNGWYNHQVTFTPDASNVGPSGLGGCGEPETYSGPETADGSVTRSCSDGAGNSASDTARFKYDDTAPTVVVNAGRDPDHNGWYNHAVTFTAQGTDYGLSGPGDCEQVSYDGPNGESASVALSCEDGAGNARSDSKTFKYDDSAPETEITGQPVDPSKNTGPAFSFDADEVGTFECRLDGGGWSECSTGKSYSGLEDGSHTFDVRAIDRANNMDASPASYTWEIDTRPPPRVSSLELHVGDVIGSLTVRLSWTNSTSADVERVIVKRRRKTVCCDGIQRRFTQTVPTDTYWYRVFTKDAAGNKSEPKRILARPILITPEDGAARSRTPHVFDWRTVAEADFYHFQLWRLKRSGVRKGTRPLLIRWPDESEVTIRRSLADGRYGWWVWRGTGSPTSGEIHVPPIGSSYFTKR